MRWNTARRIEQLLASVVLLTPPEVVLAHPTAQSEQPQPRSARMLSLGSQRPNADFPVRLKAQEVLSRLELE